MFVRTCAEWRNILGSDEMSINLLGSNSRVYILQPINEKQSPKYTIKTLQHSGGRLMVWAVSHATEVIQFIGLRTPSSKKFIEIFCKILCWHVRKITCLGFGNPSKTVVLNTLPNASNSGLRKIIQILEWPAINHRILIR